MRAIVEFRVRVLGFEILSYSICFEIACFFPCVFILTFAVLIRFECVFLCVVSCQCLWFNCKTYTLILSFYVYTFVFFSIFYLFFQYTFNQSSINTCFSSIIKILVSVRRCYFFFSPPDLSESNKCLSLSLSI